MLGSIRNVSKDLTKNSPFDSRGSLYETEPVDQSSLLCGSEWTDTLKTVSLSESGMLLTKCRYKVALSTTLLSGIDDRLNLTKETLSSPFSTLKLISASFLASGLENFVVAMALGSI